MDELEFKKIVNDIEASFSMENLKLSEKVVSDMKDLYVGNKSVNKNNFSKKRRRIVKYEFNRK